MCDVGMMNDEHGGMWYVYNCLFIEIWINDLYNIEFIDKVYIHIYIYKYQPYHWMRQKIPVLSLDDTVNTSTFIG